MKILSLLFAGFLMAGSLAGKTIPVYDITGPVTESGNAGSNPFVLNTNPRRPLIHFDIVTSLQRALQSEEVPAVVFEVDQAMFSLPQLEEIRRLLGELKAADKEVWLYADGLNFQTALLGSEATGFVLNPEGDVSLNGLYSESLYFKGMLDKIGVTVDVVHIGDFKSAGENFYRKGPSPAAEKQTDALLDSLFQTLVTEVAVGRGMTRDSLMDFIDRGTSTAEDAKKSGLVDQLQYRSDFVESLQEKYGEESIFDREYARNGEKAPEIKGFFDLMKMVFPAAEDARPKEDYIGVVVLEGAIDFLSIAPVRDEVLKLADDEKCRALVLRVNSPGGSALASEILWEALDEFQETDRPLVTSMSGVAASGGYYVASSSDYIVAEPATITGSIGVVGMKIALGDAMEKVGITTHEHKRGEHADLFNSTRPFSQEERKIVRSAMLDVYSTFKKRVSDGRGEKLSADLEKLAGGRVYSGRDALRVGLVDEMGGLGEAIVQARELAGVEEAKPILLPKPLSPLDVLFRQPGESNEGDEFISMGAETGFALKLENWWQQNLALGLVPADKAAQVRRHLEQLKAVQDDRIQLLAPPLPSF